MNEPVRFQLKREYIVERLRNAIASGELKPGQKLRQEELAARFEISSTPVREALRKLEAEGLVTSVAHQGVYVSRPSSEEIQERYRLRALLEAYAAQEAVNNLSAEPTRRLQVMAELRQYQQALIVAIEAGRKDEAVQHNAALHLRLYDEARSPLLRQMILDLWKYGYPYNSLWLVPGRAEQAQIEHEKLLVAIEAGKAEAAAQIMREHIELSSQVLVEYFQSVGNTEN